MEKTARCCSIKAVAMTAIFLLCSFAHHAYGGETSVYVKSGWFTWDEMLNGAVFVEESGAMYGAGVARKDDVAALTVAELVEVWGGSLNYDGHDLTNSTPIRSDTSYLGTKEEVALAFNYRSGKSLTLQPFGGLGHKFWIRTRSSEDWNSFYARAGMTVEFLAGGCTVFVKGGALMPVYTRTHVSLGSAGLADVVTEPEGKVSAFAEGGVKLGHFSGSVEYEGMEFGQSDKVAGTSFYSTGKGVVVIQNQAFQPRSSSTLVSLKIGYAFF